MTQEMSEATSARPYSTYSFCTAGRSGASVLLVKEGAMVGWVYDIADPHETGVWPMVETTVPFDDALYPSLTHMVHDLLRRHMNEWWARPCQHCGSFVDAPIISDDPLSIH